MTKETKELDMFTRFAAALVVATTLSGCLPGNKFVFPEGQGESIPFGTGPFTCMVGPDTVQGVLDSYSTPQGGVRYVLSIHGKQPKLEEFTQGERTKSIDFTHLNDDIYVFQEKRTFRDVDDFVVSWFVKATNHQLILYLHEPKKEVNLAQKIPHPGWDSERTPIMEGAPEDQRDLLRLMAKEVDTLFTPIAVCTL